MNNISGTAKNHLRARGETVREDLGEEMKPNEKQPIPTKELGDISRHLEAAMLLAEKLSESFADKNLYDSITSMGAAQRSLDTITETVN